MADILDQIAAAIQTRTDWRTDAETRLVAQLATISELEAANGVLEAQVADLLARIAELETPPALALDRYADHLRSEAARLISLHNPTAAEVATINGQLDKVYANLEWSITALDNAGVDPATIDLNQRHNPTNPVEYDGPQNLEPGTVLHSPVFNNAVQNKGTETSAPVILIDARHTGSPSPVGECFKTYSDDAPTIHIRTLIEPVAPHWRLNAIRGHHVTGFNVDVRATPDAFWPMDTRAGKRSANMFLYRPIVERLAFFADPADSRPEGVHGDGIQWPYSSRLFIIGGVFDGLKHPDYGPGVDEAKKWYPEMNAGFQLSAGKNGTDPPGDMFTMGCRWSRWRTGWNLSANRPLSPPIMSFGDIFDRNPVGDVTIPAHLRPHVQLVGATRPDGQPLDIKYWH